MQRDMDLARRILQELEQYPEPVGPVHISLEGKSEDEISYHIKLLHEAGLVEALDMSTLRQFSWRPMRLTWAGHEFLDASRNDEIWSRAKRVLREKGGILSFDVLKYVLIELTKRSLVLTD